MSHAKKKSIVQTIDLTRHGVIEAHAGTGKTHTIVDLVLRILEEATAGPESSPRRIHIRDILLVTYTEKAAAELQKRIREGLEERIAQIREHFRGDSSELIRHLENCRNTLHESYIGTIHSVCLRLLRTWPFETGVHFDFELVDDDQGLATALRECMRTDWQDQTSGVGWALEYLREKGAPLTAEHFSLIRRIARELLDDQHTVLDRTALQGRTLRDFADEHRRLNRQLDSALADLRKKIGNLADLMEEAGRSGKLPDDRRNLLERRCAELRRIQQGEMADLAVLQKPCKVGRSEIFPKALVSKVPQAASVLEMAEAIAGHKALSLLSASKQLLAQVLVAFIGDTAEMLARRWNHTKRHRGLVSYNDMVRLMRDAVYGNPSYVRSLRSRLRYGIIDEFQDTSAAQWEIFERVFIEDSSPASPRLYLVGDPKQSIFSFQGADIHSYLRALKTVRKSGGKVYCLEENYRSLPETVAGVNAIVASRTAEEDWFLGEGWEGETIKYTLENAVRPAARDKPPQYPPVRPTVQVMALAGRTGERARRMAQWTCDIIQALRGTMISLPHKTAWKDITLDYEHIAVIVEKHALAQPFLDAFRRAGIPAMKYKMEGVFQSPVARDLHVLLRALLYPIGDPAPRLAALLTSFFNRPPESIDPDHDLEPCTYGPSCQGEHACIAHALEEWIPLVEAQRWPQLFHRILVRTGIRQRLARLHDGERHLADLTHIVSYSLEKLCRENIGLEGLVEHLGMLRDGEASTAGDQNLHLLATSRSSVKVLSMHAAKGLQFPVVFVVTSGSRELPRGCDYVRWSDPADGRRKIRVVLSRKDAQSNEKRDDERREPLFVRQAQQERRRLLYVALTRAQAFLFVPMHLETITTEGPTQSPLPEHSPDNDLTPRLKKVLSGHGSATPCITLFDPEDWIVSPSAALALSSGTLSATAAKDSALPDIASLRLFDRICRQTSYSQLSGHSRSARDTDHTEESDEEPAIESTAAAIVQEQHRELPGGKRTGDALHVAIENLIKGRETDVTAAVRHSLWNSGVIREITRSLPSGHDPSEHVSRVIDAAVMCVRSALETPLGLPGGGTVRVGDLTPDSRIAEMEFLLSVGRHWVHGFMDLVFRIPNPAAAHPWRYFVLDWKTDTLPGYDRDTLNTVMKERHYMLQAQLYCHALDRYLAGVLGVQYEPQQNLGGAVYVFVRGAAAGGEFVWTRPSDPERDRLYVQELLGEAERQVGDTAL